MTKYFDIINEYLGWGDPAPGGLWFIGLEEAGMTEESELIELEKRLNGRCYEQVGSRQLLKNYETYCSKGARYTATNLIMSKIAIHSGFERDYRCPRKYWFGKLFQEGSKVFQSNLYPLGKKSWEGDFPPHYKDLFGFENEQASRERYEKLVSKTRWVSLKVFWDDRRPCATICFGKVRWTAFKKVFELMEPSSKDDGMEVYEQQRVILTPFFVNHQMSAQRVEKLSGIIEKWIV